jgi:hypothetical protein
MRNRPGDRVFVIATAGWLWVATDSPWWAFVGIALTAIVLNLGAAVALLRRVRRDALEAEKADDTEPEGGWAAEIAPDPHGMKPGAR